MRAAFVLGSASLPALLPLSASALGTPGLIPVDLEIVHPDNNGGGSGRSNTARTVDERRPLAPDAEITVNNIAGSVIVSAGAPNEAHIVGQLGDGIEKLDISGDRAHLSIIVRYPSSSHHSGDASLVITVPPGANLRVETVSADAQVNDIAGPVTVNTVSGDLRLRLGSAHVNAQTVSGDVTLDAPSSDTSVVSVSGDMHLSGLRDKLTIESVSGNLDLDAHDIAELHAKSISGDLRMHLNLTPAASVAADTLSGNLTLQLPPHTDAMASLKSFSGMMYCDSGALGASSGKKREYTLGNGGATRIQLSSFSGDVRIEQP